MNLYSGSASDVRIGDIVSVQKGPFTHVGVVVPTGIFQNSPNSYERIVSWQEFSQGKPVKITHTNSEAWLIIHRVEKLLAAPRAYNAFTQNCEHTVNEVVYGESNSPQLGTAFVGTLLGVALVAILSE
jgi:hypothetical protein